MSGPEQDYSQWNQNQAPPGEGQAPPWNAGGQAQPPPWNAGGQSQPPPWNAGGQGQQPPPWNAGGQWAQPNAYPTQAPVIKNYRTQSIVTLILSIFFCWFGLATAIPALIYSTRVTESIARGDYARAVDASRKARLLSWIAVGIIAFVWVIILIILVVSLSNSNTNTGFSNT